MQGTQAARRFETLGKQYAENLDAAFQELYKHMERHCIMNASVEETMQVCMTSVDGLLKETLAFAQASIEETANDIHTMYDEQLKKFISKIAPYLDTGACSEGHP